MNSKMLLSTKLTQRLAMNQQLNQVIALLQVSTIELKQQINNILESNPLIEVNEEVETDAIEEHEWQYAKNGYTRNHSYDTNNDDYLDNIASTESLRDYLVSQTLNCHFDESDQRIAEAIIDAIDDDGYLTMTLDEILLETNVDGKVNLANVELVLETIQQFEPPGIAARNTQECLRLQIERIENKLLCHLYAQKILATNALNIDKFDLKHIAKLTGLSKDEVAEGLQFIRTLDFHPAKNFNNQSEVIQDPELYVRKVNNKWQVYLANSILTRLDINKHYKAIIKQHSRDKSYKSILNQLQEAQLFISGIKRRNETLLKVASYIVEKQSAFFDNGKKSLKPMTMAEVSSELSYHESTISRITTGKYISTPFGIFELKYFFPSHIKSVSGDNKSSTAVKLLIEQLIQEEKPGQAYSDGQIAAILKERNINISRRTVTKYRESLNIPSSYLRMGMNIIKQSITQDEDDESKMEAMEMLT